MEIPTNKNVFIWTNYRSGSTALQSILEQKYHLKNYYEPFHERRTHDSDTENFFNQTSLNALPYVVKATPLHMKNILARKTLHYNFEKEINKMLEQCYVISLCRKNKIDALGSMYVATVTKIWFETKSNYRDQTPYTLDFDMAVCQKICAEYNKNTNLLKDKTCDVKMYYEDLDLTSSNYLKQTKPSNFKDIKHQIYLYVYENYPHLLGDTNDRS